MPPIKFDGELPSWVPSFGLVLVLHLIFGWGFIHFKDEIVPPKPLPVIQVSLLTPPVPLEPLTPPPPQKVEKQPRSKVEKRVAAPTPQPVEQPVAEHVLQQAPMPVIQAAPPAPETVVQPVAEPVLEPARFNAAYLNNPPPAYPFLARRRGTEGQVLVRAEVQADGSCSRVELKKTSGSELLDQAALEAVRKWRFVPAKKGSQAITAWVEVPITFKLEN